VDGISTVLVCRKHTIIIGTKCLFCIAEQCYPEQTTFIEELQFCVAGGLDTPAWECPTI